MKYNDFSTLEELTGDILKEKLVDLISDAAAYGAAEGKMNVCLITLPDGTFAQVGVFFQADADKMML